MKTDNKYYCEYRNCAKVITHLPEVFLKLQKELFCSLECKFENEGKVLESSSSVCKGQIK